MMSSIPRNATASQQADLYLKIAADYQGTSAGQRALLQGAAMLFAAGRYADAQTQFQKFLDAYPDSFFAAQAALGVATSLDAQGKTDLAAGGLPADHQHLFRRDGGELRKICPGAN